MLKLYDLTPTAYELATSPFYNDKREFTLYFGKKDDALEAIYPPCKLTSLKTNGNRLELAFNIPTKTPSLTVLFLNTGALLRIFKFRLIVSSKRKRALQG